MTAHSKVLKDNTEQPECFSQYQTFFSMSPEILHQLLLNRGIKNVAKAMPHLLAQVAADRPILATTNFRTLAPGNGGVIWFCCCWHLCFKLSFVVVVFVVVFAFSYPDKVSE